MHSSLDSRRVLPLIALVAAACGSPAAAPAPSPVATPGAGTVTQTPPSPTQRFFGDVARAPVMVLGTFHFVDSGLDRYRPQYDVDVRTPERQQEIEDLMRRLAAFRPTRVAVEVPDFRQSRIDSLYGEYRAGRYELGANEIYQLGFRLAAQLGHERVHAVDAQDHPGSLALYRQHREELEAAERAEGELNSRYRAMYTFGDSVRVKWPLREWYLYHNAPERIRLGHGHYMIGSFKADGESGYLGPDAALGWYSRNLRIFRNLQRLTASPDERVLLIIGSGHLATLQFFIEASPEHEWVPVARYLE